MLGKAFKVVDTNGHCFPLGTVVICIEDLPYPRCADVNGETQLLGREQIEPLDVPAPWVTERVDRSNPLAKQLLALPCPQWLKEWHPATYETLGDLLTHQSEDSIRDALSSDVSACEDALIELAIKTFYNR